jgi:hypothetical protein
MIWMRLAAASMPSHELESPAYWLRFKGPGFSMVLGLETVYEITLRRQLAAC